MAKRPTYKDDPYPDYRDGNCRDVSGQIVPCGSEHVVSPAKWDDDESDANATDENE